MTMSAHLRDRWPRLGRRAVAEFPLAGKRRRGRAGRRHIAWALAALTVAALIGAVVTLAPAVTARATIAAAVMAGALYLAAHGLRAIRLAMLAVPLLGVSARTAALLHVATAPATFLLPLKIGELARLHQLWFAGKRASGAVIVLLLERMLDAVMLLSLFLWATAGGAPAHGGMAITMALTVAAVTIGAIVLLLGPSALASLQRYVVINHQSRHAIRALPLIDLLRLGIGDGAALMRRQGAQLLVVSALIWTLELLAAGLFVEWGGASALRETALLLLGRINQEWRALAGGAVDPAVAASASTSLMVLLLTAPAAIILYVRRLDWEPSRRPVDPRPFGERLHGA